MCSGHSQRTGDYHYHWAPSCLITQASSNHTKTYGLHGPQIGWSFDGFPVYGPIGFSGVSITHAQLDECGGLAGEIPQLDGFKYRYYLPGATGDLWSLPGSPRPSSSDYPFTMKCYKGCTQVWWFFSQLLLQNHCNTFYRTFLVISVSNLSLSTPFVFIPLQIHDHYKTHKGRNQ